MEMAPRLTVPSGPLPGTCSSAACFVCTLATWALFLCLEDTKRISTLGCRIYPSLCLQCLLPAPPPCPVSSQDWLFQGLGPCSNVCSLDTSPTTSAATEALPQHSPVSSLSSSRALTVPQVLFVPDVSGSATVSRGPERFRGFGRVGSVNTYL